MGCWKMRWLGEQVLAHSLFVAERSCIDPDATPPNLPITSTQLLGRYYLCLTISPPSYYYLGILGVCLPHHQSHLPVHMSFPITGSFDCSLALA